LGNVHRRHIPSDVDDLANDDVVGDAGGVLGDTLDACPWATARTVTSSSQSVRIVPPIEQLLERGKRIVRSGPTKLLIGALGGIFVACFKLGLRKDKLVDLQPLEAAESLGWSAIFKVSHSIALGARVRTSTSNRFEFHQTGVTVVQNPI
jgi:hypothetical protein